MILGRPEPGYGQPYRFAYAQMAISRLGYRETKDERDWVPVREVYDRYKETWQSSPKGAQFPTLLCRQEVGKLLVVMYPTITRVKRWAEGKKVRGIASMAGPGGLRSPQGRGLRSPEYWKQVLEDMRETENDGSTTTDNERNTE